MREGRRKKLRASPERIAVLDAAARLGKFAWQVEEQMPHAELCEWMAYKEIEAERHEKIEYYLAQIAYCAVLPYQRKGSSVKIKDYLIKFGKPAKRKLTAEQLRNVVCGWFGVNPNKKKGVENGG